ncbi:MAG: hypothetical protein R6U10_02860 [Thermoplasmatota archaeon]
MPSSSKKEYDVDILWQHDHSEVKGYSSLAVDSHGNVYACGIAPDEEHGVIVKYGPDGDVKWTDTALPKPLDVQAYRSVAENTAAEIPAAALPQEERYGAFLDIAVDANDDVVVAGSYCHTDPLRIYIMVQKYRPDGTVRWSKEYMRRALNHAMGVTVDGDGDIYLVGQGGIGATLLQPNKVTLKALAMKIDGSNGTVIWVRTRKKGQYMWYHDAAVARDGSLVVSGYYLDGGVIHPVVSMFRGRRGLWTRYLVPPDGNKRTAGIARHADRSFHVVGNTEAAQTSNISPYLMRFSPELHIRWQAEDDANAFLYGTDVLADGTVIATGMHLSKAEYYAALYDQTTGQKIQDIFLGPVNASGVNFNDYLKGVAAGPDGGVVLAGAWNPGKVIKIRLTAATGEDSHVLRVHVQPPNSGTVTPGGGSYPAGETVTLHAHPAQGYTFSHWTGDATGSSATTRVTMDNDISATAYFTERETSWLARLLQWLLGRR